jgi:hypothetical protein
MRRGRVDLARGEVSVDRIIRGARDGFRPRRLVRSLMTIVSTREHGPESARFGTLICIVEQRAPDAGAEIKGIRERIVGR